MVPRGIRNNNPLNIRKGNNWKGERPNQTDKAFEEFETMQMGIRAGFILLKKYITGYGGKTPPFNTVEKIVKRWAPPTENATRNYIDFVCRDMSVNMSQTLSFKDRKTMVDLVYAMIFVECGQRVDKEIISSAYDLV